MPLYKDRDNLGDKRVSDSDLWNPVIRPSVANLSIEMKNVSGLSLKNQQQNSKNTSDLEARN